jgi:hypothetical protein
MDPTASVLQASAPEVHYLCGGKEFVTGMVTFFG